MASRQPNQVASGELMRKSRAVVGFWLMHCLRKPAELIDAPLQELFERTAAGDLRVVEGETYGLSEVRRCHEDLQARGPRASCCSIPRASAPSKLRSAE